MAEHPAETMRRASSRLREAAGAAASGPWTAGERGGEAVVTHETTSRIATASWRGDAAWIALMHPGAGVALARWLEEAADHAETRISGPRWWDKGCAGYVGSACHCWDGAMATARAILGEAGTEAGEPP